MDDGIIVEDDLEDSVAVDSGQYEEHFVAFVDLLGFSEFSAKTEEHQRSQVLDLLLRIAALRREFDVKILPAHPDDKNAKRVSVTPAISTFSDHIVISFPLRPFAKDVVSDDRIIASVVLGEFIKLVSHLAAAALSLGLLVRGGATVGKLYHARGVVFGEGLVEAYNLESRTAAHPRVVLSANIVKRNGWTPEEHPSFFALDEDGLYYIDYIRDLAKAVGCAKDVFGLARDWYENVVNIISKNLAEHREKGELSKLSKWTWFARKFRAALEAAEQAEPRTLEFFKISTDLMPWSRRGVIEQSDAPSPRPRFVKLENARLIVLTQRQKD